MAGVGNEEDWEDYVQDFLAELGWKPLHGRDIAPDALTGERTSWYDVVLEDTFRQALHRLNPDVPPLYLDQAAAEILRPTSQDAVTENHRLHEYLTTGYSGLTYTDDDGVEHSPTITLLSADPSRNTYASVNQVTVRKPGSTRRFDVLLYVDGLPLAVMELKKAGTASATIEGAHNQLGVYLDEFPMAFRFTLLTVVSDGIHARYGTPFTPWNHYSPWNVDEGGRPVTFGQLDTTGHPLTELDTLLDGLFSPERLDALLRGFTTYVQTDKGLSKRIAKPHQYFAVAKALASTHRAVGTDGRAGVVWHTQGSGKSMEMELYTAAVLRDPALANPTVLLITDRTELDGQLYDSFLASTILPETPRQVESREELREVLTQSGSGGIYFTTLQKFGLTNDERLSGAEHPILSERRNIIVVVDEAHRSHYDNLDGYAAHLHHALPHATLIAFTGTPIAEGERDTRRVFGAEIDVYDLNRAVEDGATVPVVFEPRLISLTRADGVDDDALDDAAEELTADLDEDSRHRIEQSVAVMETIYGAPERIKVLAKDLVHHWETRRDAVSPMIGGPGKAMVVTATRSIAARLYEEVIRLRPEWHSDDDAEGIIKVVYTAAPSDPAEIRQHMRNASQLKAVKERVKNADDPLQIVIVKDMMLTGFDAPALHTLYVDRPLHGALLMQTLARVNRTYEGKDSGLLVAYAPLADSLAKALQEFTTDADATGQRAVGRDAGEAARIVRTLLSDLDGIVEIDWHKIIDADPMRGWRDAYVRVASRLLDPSTAGNSDPEDGNARPLRDKFRAKTSQLASAWALAANVDGLDDVRGDVRFYTEVRTWLAKLDADQRAADGRPVPEDVRRLLGELVITSAASTGVVDIYREAGVDLPNLAALTPEWLEEVAKPSKAQLAIERLKAAILREAHAATAGNQVRETHFSERINALMLRYTNQQLTAAQVLAELVDLAKEAAAEGQRGQRFDPPLNKDELAFYDVVALNESAVTELGDEVLAQIARELVQVMRRDTKTDWSRRSDVRAKLRSSVKRLLRKYGYPPDQRDETVSRVLDAVERP